MLVRYAAALSSLLGCPVHAPWACIQERRQRPEHGIPILNQSYPIPYLHCQIDDAKLSGPESAVSPFAFPGFFGGGKCEVQAHCPVFICDRVANHQFPVIPVRAPASQRSCLEPKPRSYDHSLGSVIQPNTTY
jgi:hypothetical protein